MTRNPVAITSLQNDRVKALVRLRSARERRSTGLMIIEEKLVIERALTAGVAVQEVWSCQERETPEIAALRAGIWDSAGCDRFLVSAPVMDKIAYRDRTEGLLIVARIPRLSLDDLKLPADRAPLVVVVENLEKPGNLGAVQRVADAVGADAVLVCGAGTDLYNPNVLRASRGACFHVPCLAAESAEILDFLKRHDIRTVATTPGAQTGWTEADLTGPTAVVLGAEHEGLSESWLQAADLKISLPMRGAGDSLNISATAAILLYESLRQRSVPTKAT